MSHASNVVHCHVPECPHAFDFVPLQPRKDNPDARCPACDGWGQWNTEIDLIRLRCKRAAFDRCHGAGWIETGTDPIAIPDLKMTADEYPQWTVRYEPAEGSLFVNA